MVKAPGCRSYLNLVSVFACWLNAGSSNAPFRGSITTAAFPRIMRSNPLTPKLSFMQLQHASCSAGSRQRQQNDFFHRFLGFSTTSSDVIYRFLRSGTWEEVR